MKTACFLIVLCGLPSLLLAQLDPTATPTRLGTATPTPRRTPGPRPAKVRLTAAEADALVKEMSATVEKIRHLKFKTPVTMQIIDGASARSQFKSKIQPRDEEQMRYTQEVYARLGLVAKGTDLVADFLNMAEEGVDGYYEPGAKTFYLLDHVAKDDVRAVMAHELTHALEDQHYDLAALSKRAENNDDRATALAALVEGSAMVVMLVYLDQEMRQGRAAMSEAREDQTDRANRLKSAPSFVRRSLMLPYVLGFSFLLRGHPWNFHRGGVFISDLDHAYSRPPLSTRHIIHPELYWRRPDIQFTPPKLPDLSKTLGEGWRRTTEGSIGELGIAVLTGVKLDFDRDDILMPATWSNRLSAGCVGDVYQQYKNGDRTVTILMTGWENQRMAEEFAAGWKAVRGRAHYRYGSNHFMVMGDYGTPDTAEALAAAAFAGVKFWPHDEGVGQWPPARGPDVYLD